MRHTKLHPLLPSGIVCTMISCLLLIIAPRTGSAQLQMNYGTAFDNSFSKIIQDGSFYYVLGSDEPGTGLLPRATVSRLDAQGQLQWTLTLDIASVWNDAVRVSASGDLLLVGSTLPIDPNTKSLMACVTSLPLGGNGSFKFLKRYDAFGEDAFRRIVENPVPASAAFPYYVLGYQNQPLSPTTDDVVVLNVDANCNVNWKKSISTAGDDEWYQDIEALANGDLLLVGGANGVIFKIDNNGVAIGGVQISQIYFLDAASTASGDIYAVANAFSGTEAFLMKFDQDLLLQWDREIPQLKTISQVWEASPGLIYAVGRGTFSSIDRDVIVKIAENPLMVVWTKYLHAGSGAKDGSAWFLPPANLAYTDTRVLPNGFGGDCAFLSISDLELDNCMVTEVAAGLIPVNPLPDGPVLPITEPFPLPNGIAFAGFLQIWQQDTVCSNAPCEVDIVLTLIDSCGLVQVCANPGGPTPYSYQWCDGQTQQCLNMQLDCGPHTFCVTVTCGDGSMASASLSTVISDLIPPTALCVNSFTVALNANCVASISAADIDNGSFDNCQIDSMSLSANTFTQCDTFPVTLTVVDWCGNLATCSTQVIAVDNILPVLTGCPQNMTVSGTLNTMGICEANLQITSPTATDNCDPAVSLTNSFNNTNNASGTYPQGSTSVIWTAMDDCENVATCAFTVEVNCDTCSCVGFDNLAFYYGAPPNNGWAIPVSCEDDSTFALPWIPSDGLYFFQGYLQCTDTCNTSVDYAINAVGGGNLITGTALSGAVGGGSTYFNIITGFHPAPGNYQFVLTGHCGSDTCVCNIDFSVPDCDTCGCGTYTDLFYRPVQGLPNQSIACGDTLLAQCDGSTPWTLGGDYLCSGPNCPPVTPMFWMLMGPSGSSSGSMSANSGFSMSIPAADFNTTGLHQLTLKALCGQDTCVCDFMVEVACDTCQCGTFSDMFIRGPQGAMSRPVTCGDPPINIGCPTPGIGYTLTGNFLCDGTGCPPDADVDWTLEGPDGSSVANGLTQAPWFAFTLASSYFSQSGIYTLTLSGHCGDQLCSCIIQFMVDEGCMDTCPCDINDLLSDVNQGFATSLTGNSCRACFTPLSLSDCDEVEWLVDDPLGTPVGSSIGNQTFCYSFPVAGTYTVYMSVIRKRADGTLCESFKKAQTVTVTCINRAECNVSLIGNPTFSQGAQAGSLGDPGMSTGWMKVWGDPHINHSNSSSFDGWTVALSGNADTSDVLSRMDFICLAKEAGNISLRLYTDPIPGAPEISAGRGKPRLVIQFQQEADFILNDCPEESCYTVASVDLSAIDTGWFDLDIPYDLSDWMVFDPCGGVQVRPNIYVSNAFGESQGGEQNRFRLELDHFCLDGLLVGINEPRQEHNIHLFPNPTSGEMSLRFDREIKNQTQLEILDLWGRRVQAQRLVSGMEEQTFTMATLPAGIYFVRIREVGVPVWVEKVVKL